MEKVNQAIDRRIQQVEAMTLVKADSGKEKELALIGEIKDVFVGAVTQGLRINQKTSDYYLQMGKLLDTEGPRLKEARVYGAFCREVGLKKSTANNIELLYNCFREKVGDMIARLPVRYLLIICTHGKKQDGSSLKTINDFIECCLENEESIRKGSFSKVPLSAFKAHVQGVQWEGKKQAKITEVGPYKVREDTTGKSVTIVLDNESLQASVSEYLCECMGKIESWKKNLQRVGGREMEREPTEQLAAEPETRASGEVPMLPEVIEINKFMREQEGTAPAQVIPFPKKSEEDETGQEATAGADVSDSFSVAHVGLDDSREGVMVLE